MTRLGIGALVLAALLGCSGYILGTKAFQPAAPPEEITLKNLIARGPEGNANLILSDFVLCENYVYEYNGPNKNSWTKMWIPVLPETGSTFTEEELTPRDVKILIYSTSIRNEQQLETRLSVPKLQGMVTNRIDSIDRKAHDLLKKSYPNTDFDKCLIFQEGRTAISPRVVVLRGFVFLMGAGSAVSLLGGIAFLVVGIVRGTK